MKQSTRAIVCLCVLGWSAGSAGAPPIQRPITSEAQRVPISPPPAVVSPQPQPQLQPVPTDVAPAPISPVLRERPPVGTKFLRRMLAADPQPSIGPNAEILLFIHGMDSRAEEADDITKALFATVGNAPPAAPAATVAPPDPAPVIAALNQLLQKYKPCIIEKYETQADMEARGFPHSPPNPRSSGLMTASGLQPRNVVTCVAGNACALIDRVNGFSVLQAQANRGDPTNFQMSLERIVPQDCFNCSKHAEMHTKHVHCTMEAGGNNGIGGGPLGPIGPAFEGCKAGVDAVALGNAVIHEVGVAISNISALIAPSSQAAGGPTIATNRTILHFNSCPNPSGGCPEMCDNPDTIVGNQRIARMPLDMLQGQPVTLYFPAAVAPWSNLLDSGPPAGTQLNVPVAHNIGQNEGRLHPTLRAVAKAGDPFFSLALASYMFGSQNNLWGAALADLSVTGHNAFAKFSQTPPQDDFCQALVGQTPPQMPVTQPPPLSTPPQITPLAPDQLIGGCRSALDRAYRVANFLRAGQRGDTLALKQAKVTERNALGWIAVSGEDDSPHRPVDVPSSDFPQFTLDVNVNAGAPFSSLSSRVITVRTRYTIAQMPSRNGKNLVVISLDLPSSGYATNLNYEDISPLSDIGQLKTTNLPVPLPVLPGIEFVAPGIGVFPPGTMLPANIPLPDFQASGNTPILKFIEDFVVAFVDTLDQRVPIKGSIKAVMGGSLGGNMTLRLGERGESWTRNVVVWSPASIWDSLGGGADILKHQGPRGAWTNASQVMSTPPGSPAAAPFRQQFFATWDKAIVPVIVPMAQSDTWTSNFYQCKSTSVAAARLDRQETYDQNFLGWHWRLGAEQLLFSHQNINPMTGQRLFTAIHMPMLLGCGLEDKVPYNDICPATQATAPHMTNTPGKALFLGETGHSLDNERRVFWAQQVSQFLGL